MAKKPLMKEPSPETVRVPKKKGRPRKNPPVAVGDEAELTIGD